LLQQTIIAITHSNTETCWFDLATSENTFILSVGAEYGKIFAEKPRGYITVARRKSTKPIDVEQQLNSPNFAVVVP
jgi:hypothetical protein